ncbi:MAG: outer membrane lipoprotein-sorting protein [Bacteroidia bacterium]
MPKAGVVIILFLFGFNSDNLNGIEILKKSESLYQIGDVVGEVQVELIRPSWNKTYSIKIWTKGDDHALAYVLSPEKDKGTVILKTADEVFNFIPRINKIVKMPMSLMSQKWMGSDMTMDDLLRGTNMSQDYHVQLNGNEIINRRNCHALILNPKENAQVLWGRIELWVDKTTFNQMKMVFYDEDMEEVHRIIGGQIEKMGGKWVVSSYEMIPAVKKNQKTLFTYKSLDFSQNLPLDMFSKENMKQLRP